MTHHVAVVAALTIVALAARDLDAQSKRQFRSRAAFAKLDTMALMDSAEMRLLNPRERFDSLMIQMLDHLNVAYAPAVGLEPTRIRNWEGFSTQAHPVAGILVDRPEVDGLVKLLKDHKELAGVPNDEIERRVNHVVQFLVGHEYAHLVQYALLPRDSVESVNATRIIECAADIVGAALHQRYARARFGEGKLLEAALAATANFGWEIGAGNWLDGTSHPIREHRMQCIQVGQGTMIADAQELTAWSLSESRRITSVGSAVDRDKGVAVSRDSSMAAFLSELTTLASRGAAAMLDLQGPALPEPGMFILRKSLSTPWRCVLGVEEGRSTAICDVILFRNEAVSAYDRLVSSAAEVLDRNEWQRDSASVLLAGTGKLEGFTRRVDGRVRGRVEVSVSQNSVGAQSPMQQMPQQSRVVLKIVGSGSLRSSPPPPRAFFAGRVE